MSKFSLYTGLIKKYDKAGQVGLQQGIIYLEYFPLDLYHDAHFVFLWGCDKVRV